MTNTARTIWPHLADDIGPPKQQQQRASSPLAQSMYPSLSLQSKPRDTWQERYGEMVGLRKIDAREGRR